MLELADLIGANLERGLVDHYTSGLGVSSELLSLLAGYAPGVLGGNIFYFQASQAKESNQILNCFDTSNIVKVKGDHYSVMRGEGVETIAEHIIKHSSNNA